MKVGRASQIAAVLISFTIAAGAAATVTIYQTNKELTQKADEIAVGTVKGANAYADAKTGRTYTLTTVTVSEWLKGGNEKEIVIRQLGGQRESKYSKVSGDAKLIPGEEAVLFMKKGDGVRYLTALAQSKFSVVLDKATGKKMVKRDMEDLSVGTMDSGGAFQLKAVQSQEQPVSLDDFLTEIRGYLKGKK